MRIEVELRRARHDHGEELCRVYQRHLHIGPLILWIGGVWRT